MLAAVGVFSPKNVVFCYFVLRNQTVSKDNKLSNLTEKNGTRVRIDSYVPFSFLLSAVL